MTKNQEINLIILNGLNSDSEIQNSEIFPSSFIIDRINTLRNHGINPLTFIIKFDYSKLVSFVYHILTKKKLLSKKLCNSSVYDNENIVVITKKWSFFEAISIKYFAKNAANDIVNKIDLKSNTILHVHWSYPHGYIGMLIAHKLNIPYIITTHGGDINEGAATSRRRRKYIIKALNCANNTIFVSSDSLDNAIKYGYNGINASVIPNGVDLSLFMPVSKKCAMIKTNFKQTHKYVVGFVGRLHHHKRADKLPQIFNEINKYTQDVEFIVIGTGPMETDIINKCNYNKLKVTFIPMVKHEEISYWMNLFDVMILPSRTEGWPCVILEAFACGITIVASNVGGIGEAMGGYGELVNEGECFEERFGKITSDLINYNKYDNKEDLIKYANKFTWDYTVDKEIELYLNLINK